MSETIQELQNKALEKLRTGRRLILNWGIGVGKSRVAFNAMNSIIDSVPHARFLLMVQETAHKQNWINDMIEAVGIDRTGRILSNTTIDCYASLKKHENTQWNLIIFDEGHHLRSPLRQDIIKSMQAERVLVLTATASDNNDCDDMLETLNFTFGEFQSMSFVHYEPDNMDGSKAITGAIPLKVSTAEDKQIAKQVKWLVDTQNGRFINTDGQYANRLVGKLEDIQSTNMPQPFYAVTFKQNEAETNTVYIPKKLSIAVLASLSSLPEPDRLPITIDIMQNGGWPQYTLSFGRTKVKWDKSIIENYPKDNNLKIDYLDGVVGKIQKRLTKI